MTLGNKSTAEASSDILMALQQTKNCPKQPPPATKRSAGIAIALALALIAATFLVHSPAISSGFIWDDDERIYENPLHQDPHGLWKCWFATDLPDYWPLTRTTFWIEWQIWGDNPKPYHVTNIALHALAAVALWRLLIRLGLSRLGALLAGLLFAVHPVTVESVAWISERKNVLSMLLYLLSILAYLRFEDRQAPRWYALALLAGLAALLAKSTVAALPIVLLICAWWRRGRIAHIDLLRTVPFFAMSMVLGLIELWFEHHNAISGEAVRPEGILSRIASVGWVTWFYLYKIVLPIDLAMIYPRWNIDSRRILSYAPLALLIAGMAVLWHYRKGWSRGPLASLGSFVIVLAPVLGLLDMSYARFSLVADHLQYPGMPGLMALIGAVLAAAWTWALKRNHRALAAALPVLIGAVLLALAVLTWRQAQVYQDEITLWSQTIARNSRSSAAYGNRGNTYKKRGDYDRTLADCNKAIELNPNYDDAYCIRAVAHNHYGDYERAIKDSTKAIELKPNYVEAYNNRGVSYGAQRRYAQAIQDFNQAIQINPRMEGAYCNRSNAYLAMGDNNRAIQDCTKAIELKPDCAKAYNNRGLAYGNLRDYRQAIRDLSKGIELKLDGADIFYSRGTAYDETGQPALAIQDYARAIELKPDYVMAYNNMANSCYRLRDFDRAIANYTKAIELKPDLVLTYQNRAVCYYDLKQYDQAWADIRKIRQRGGTPNPMLLQQLGRDSGKTE